MNDSLMILQNELKRVGRAAFLVTSPQNRFYLTGFYSSEGILMVLEEECVLFVDFRYIEAARAAAQDIDIILFERENIKKLEGLLRNLRIETVFFEEDYINYSSYQKYRDRFMGFKFTSSNGMIQRLRRRKEDYEIVKIAAAQKLCEEALKRIIPHFSEGVTEKQMALKLDIALRELGADKNSFDTIMLFGENTAKPHGVPSNRKLRQGDFILVDFGAMLNGYASDMTRTLCFGEPTDNMKKVYEIVKNAQQEALNMLREGITSEKADRAARKIIEDAGYGECFGHSLGHGVGIDVHEEPRLSPKNKEVLLEDNVVSVEPGIYIEGSFGVRIEDLVVIKKDGVKNLNSFPKELILLSTEKSS